MLCLSLWQPWASLIAVGAKDIETRDWGPPAATIGHMIAIHAAKRPVSKSLDYIDPENLPRLDELFGRGAMGCPARRAWVEDLPLGAVVCVARLTGAYRFGEEIGNGPAINITRRITGSPWRPSITPNPWGNYTEGRWGWCFDQVRALPDPLPLRGKQGLFIISSADAARVLPT